MKKHFILVSILFLMVAAMPFAAFCAEYQHKIAVEGMTFAWSLDGDKINVELTAKTTGWVSVGFDPENAMEGANIIIGAVSDGNLSVEDHYGNRKRGHSSDKALGGSNDLINAAGSEENGTTTISFSIPLKTDDKFDKNIVTDAPMKIMLAHGAGRDSFKTRHPFRTVYEVNFSTGEHKKLK